MQPLRTEDVELQTIKLIRIVPDAEAGEGGFDGLKRQPSRLAKRLPFLVIVVLPTLLAALYFFALAAPRYQSEAKFVLRSPGSAAQSAISAFVSGSSIVRSGDDASIAKEYMASRDAMEKLLVEDGLQAVFDKAGFDPLWSFPGLFRSASTERMWKHYSSFINIEYDQSSGISTLDFQAFTAEDAQRLAKALLHHAENFLNGLNGRAQRDAVQSAIKDVEEAKQRAYQALDKVTDFRNRETVIDPTKSSLPIVEGISRLSLETANANARLAELATAAPQSPEIASLRTRVAALQDQIAKQRLLLGGDSSSLAPRIAEYERLLLEQSFAERTFVSTLASLELARLDAERQRVFLETVTSPDIPDYPAYPYRLVSVLGTLAICYAVYRIFSSVLNDLLEHAQL